MLIALVCGLVAAALTVFYLKQVESKYRQANKPKIEVLTTVVVPRANLAKGTVLTSKTVSARKVPEAFLPSNAIMAKDFKKVVNRTLKSPVQKGRPLTWNAITGKAAKHFSGNLELGRRAMSIKVNKIDSFDGLLRPGDHIDLLGSFALSSLGVSETTAVEPNSDVSDEVVMPVLENVVVLSAGREDLTGRRYERSQSKNSADGFNMEFTVITLDLTPKQVARVEIAKSTGDVFAVLRHPKDTSLVDFEYLGVELLLQPDAPDAVDLVLDAEGNVVGRVVGDNVVDANGNIIGKVVDGKPVTFDGKPMGQIVENVSADDPILRVVETADLVRDADGNVVGKIVDGQILDADGKVIGRVDAQGRPVDASGKVLGRIEKNVALDASGNPVDVSRSLVAASKTRREQVVRDADGNVIGRVVNGKVVDASGKVIGQLDKNGRPVGVDGKKLGRLENVLVDRNGKVVASEAQVVRDASGKIIGRVINGQVVDESGTVIGRVDASGKAVSLSGESLGEVGTALLDKDGKPQGSISKVVRDSDGNVIGRIVNGKVIDADGKVIGVVGKDGVPVALGKKLGRESVVVRDASGKVVGKVEQVVRDASGKIIGRVVNGQVVDASGKVVGKVGKDGVPVGLNGERLGSVERVITDASGKVVGRVDKDGVPIGLDGKVLGKVERVVTDANGKVVGKIDQVVRDVDGNIVGRIVDGKVLDADGKVVGTVGADGVPVGLDGRSLGTVEKVVLDADGKVVGLIGEDGTVREVTKKPMGTVDSVVTDAAGQVVSEAVEVVRDASGKIIGRLVDGKVVDADGKVIGELKGGKVVDASGKVIAVGVAVTSEDPLVVDAALRNVKGSSVVRKIDYIDFISGGSAEDGIVPVRRVRLE